MKRISLAFLLLLCVSGFSQNLTQKEFVAIIIEIDRKDDMHPKDIFYWITESNKVNKKYEFDFYPLFLKLFYPSNSYDACCIGKESRFYTHTEDSQFEFTKAFEKKQKEFRDFLKKNSKVIQVIKKRNKWNKLLNEKVTISATAITAELCKCKIKDDRHFESVFLPTSDFKLNPKFWESKNAFYLTDRDYSLLRANY